MNKRAEEVTETVENSEKMNNIKSKSKKSVYIYIAALFLIVVLFILLSYFMQQRNNSVLHTLNEKNATAQQNIEDLQSTNLLIQAENDEYRTKIAALEKQVDDLEEQVRIIRRDWQTDVQNVLKNDAAKYDALLAQYNELIEKYETKGNKK